MFVKSRRIYNIDSSGGVRTINTIEKQSVVNRTIQSVRKSIESKAEKPGVETAAGYYSQSNSSGPSATSSEVSNGAMYAPVLASLGLDISAEQTPGGRVSMNRMYRDMYYHDSVCGTAVDLLSTLPFSDFTLNASSKKQYIKYQEACDALKIKQMFPVMSLEYHVVGAFVSSLEWDEGQGKFRNAMVHDIDHCKLTPSAYHGGDPSITLNLPQHILSLFTKDKESIPFIFRDSGKQKEVLLNPENTIFIPRRSLVRDFGGVSYFRRALVVWLIEKAHILGQIDQSYKRQRPIMHLEIGDSDWEASPEEKSQIVQNFIEAELDPLGAYVATRPGININEIRNGADYFKWTDIVDSLTAIKLRSLGLSDSFLSAEASYATLEQTLSVTMERFRDFRSMTERELLYEKVFVRIARQNSFLKRKSVETAYSENEETADGTYDHSRLDLPVIQWQKRLMPEADDAYLQILGTLEEKGVPIPLRGWAAAGGFNIDKLLESESDDITLRTRISEWKKKLEKVQPSLNTEEEASFSPLSIGNRKFDDKTSDMIREPIDFDSKGRRRLLTRRGQKLLTEKMHRKISSSMVELAKKENSRVRRNAPAKKPFFNIPDDFFDEEED